MFNFNNNIEIFTNRKMIHRLHQKLPDSGLYYFPMIQGPLTNLWLIYCLAVWMIIVYMVDEKSLFR